MEHFGSLPFASLEDTTWCDAIEGTTVVNNNGGNDEDDVDLDLNQWDHLTATYDSTDLFQETGLNNNDTPSSSQQHEQQQFTLHGEPSFSFTGSFNGTRSNNSTNVFQNATLLHESVASNYLGASTPQGVASALEMHLGGNQQQISSTQLVGQIYATKDLGLTLPQPTPLLVGMTTSEVNLLRFLHDPPHQKTCGMDQLHQPSSSSSLHNAYFQQDEGLVSTTPILSSHDTMKSVVPVGSFGGGMCVSENAHGGPQAVTDLQSLFASSQSTAAPLENSATTHAFTVGRNVSPTSLQRQTVSKLVDTVPSLSAQWNGTVETAGAATCSLKLPPPSCQTPKVALASTPPQLQLPQVDVPMIAPLTAYNYFYRNERDTIVNGMMHANDPIPASDLDFTPNKMAQLLHHHWTVDPFKKKRQHRKTHGIMEFTKLSKVIAQRWRTLPEHGREFYREVANVDQQRYETYLAHMRQQMQGCPAVSPTSTISNNSIAASSTTADAFSM